VITTQQLRISPDEQRLLDQLHNDRYIESQSSHGTDDRNERRWFNSGMDHARSIVETWVAERAQQRAERLRCFIHDEAIRKFDEAVAPMVEGTEP